MARSLIVKENTEKFRLIKLFGEGRSGSKTLALRAVKKYYPHLVEKWERFSKTLPVCQAITKKP